ncbi:MFS transporter small subunit [Tunturiibacter gelidoferens]|uniref:Oxalate:formate antiporter n=1 Tax=Tunturiibacter gelidiferens TaxID=3069689 RepID=A0AAU7YWK7_9BACT
MADSTNIKKSSPLLIAAAWIVVIIPTAWGLDYTVKNALKIFATTPAPTVPAK